ncbi:hypothetical protein LG288_03530 [Idiomarina seosinensis]|uniref:hypothetical protein n=1 Tax=Idiomarina seosinensis TaxID=281739 RepID=UPI00384E5A80
MWKNVTFISVLLLAAEANAEVCDAEWVQAEYRISHTTEAAEQHTEMSLWRKPQHVAHQYPQTQMTEMWQFVREEMLKPTRYFDAHQRAIEYQPNDIIHGKRETNWSYRNQLIADKLLQRMNKISEQGSGCSKTETYQLQLAQQTLVIDWLPAYQLPKRFQRSDSRGNRIIWQQQRLNQDKAVITDFFAHRDVYQATDYADIGDDHTDPFLTNMVSQGFIEAGASGFYDTEGNALEAEHQH